MQHGLERVQDVGEQGVQQVALNVESEDDGHVGEDVAGVEEEQAREHGVEHG